VEGPEATVSLSVGKLVPIYNNVAWDEAYLRTSEQAQNKV